MSEDQRRFVTLVRHAFEAYYNATVNLRNDIYEANQMVKGGFRQWTVEDRNRLKAEERPILTFNNISPVVNFIAGYQAAREQDFRAFPRGNMAEQLGRLMTAQIKYAMDVGGGVHVFHQWFRRGVIASPAILEVGRTFDNVDDLVDGEVSFDCLPPTAWYTEVGARRYDRQDAQWMGKLMWFRPEEASRRWPKSASLFDVSQNRDWTTQDPTLTGVPEHILTELFDSRTGRVRVLQHWYRSPITVNLVVNSQTGDVKRMDSGKAAEDFISSIRSTAGKQAAAPYQIVQAESQSALVNKVTGQVHPFNTPDAAERGLDNLKRQAGTQAASVFDIVTRPTTALRVAHLTGWALLDDGPSPYGSDWRFPFVPFTCYQDDDDYLGMKGVVFDLMDAQREINWHHATMLDSLIRGPKSGYWLSKQEQSNFPRLKREISRAGFMGEYVGQPPVPVTPALLNEGDMRMLDFGIEAIMRMSMVTGEMLGQTTQKTVSGRAIQARQAGGITGLSSVFQNWATSKRTAGELILRRIQQFYPVEKMDRVVGQVQRMMRLSNPMMSTQQPIPNEQMLAYFKQLKTIDMDIVVDFQEASPTTRQAMVTQLMQLKAAGVPIPMEVILEASDIPYKEEVKQALAKQGEQAPNPDLAKAISAGQGSQPAQPGGVNLTQ